MKKRLYFAIALTVVAALLADVANFNSWFGYRSEGADGDFGAFVLPAMLLMFITAAPLYGFSQRSVLSLVYVTLGLGTTKYVPSSQLPNLAKTPMLLCVAVVMLIFIGVVAWGERRRKKRGKM